MPAPPHATTGNRTRAPRLTYFLPTFEGMHGGSTAGWRDALAIARHAEEIGFDGVALGEHFFARFGGETQGGWDPWSWLAGLAATTTRLTLTPLVTCTAYRNPALIAKMAETIDEMSDGRFVLGLGAGWLKDEFEAFGYPFDRRVSRFAEALQIIHGLLRQGRVDFAGEYYRARDCELRPRGPRPQGPPILIGTTGRRMLGLAARYADVWDTNFRPPDQLPALQAALDTACAEVGRDPSTVTRSASITVATTGTRNLFGMPAHLSGTPQAIAEGLRAYADAGLSEVVVWLTPNTLAGIEGFAPVLDLLDR